MYIYVHKTRSERKVISFKHPFVQGSVAQRRGMKLPSVRPTSTPQQVGELWMVISSPFLIGNPKLNLYFSRGFWILNSEKGGVDTVDGSEIKREKQEREETRCKQAETVGGNQMVVSKYVQVPVHTMSSTLSNYENIHPGNLT